MACSLDGAKPLSEPMLEYVDWTLRNKLPCTFNRNSNIFIQENALEDVVCEMAFILSRPQCANIDSFHRHVIFTFAGFSTESMILWKKSDPIIQTFNFFLASFAMLAPLVARPFLDDTNKKMNQTLLRNSAEINRPSISNISEAHDVMDTTESQDSLFNGTFFPCLLVNFPLLLLALHRLILFIPERKCIINEKTKPTQLPGVSGNEHTNKARQAVLSMMFIFAGIFPGGCEMVWAGFGAGYATKYQSWTMKKAALIPFLFWMVSMIGRFLSILVAKLVEPPRILTLCSLCLIAVSAVLVILGENHSIALLVCCGITAALNSPFYASGVSWACSTLGVSGRNSSLFMAGYSIGCMFSPMLTARLCQAYGARMFSRTALGINVIVFLSIVIICVIQRLWRPAERRRANYECELIAPISGKGTI